MLSRISFRFLITAAASVALAVGVPVAALAAGGHKGHAYGKEGNGSTHGHKGKGHKSTGAHGVHKGMMVLDQSLAPSIVADPTLHGVKPGGLPWVMSKGNVRLKADGKLMLSVKGLIIPEMGNAGPVKTISASLYCGPESEEAAATTQEVPLSSKGDARIFDKTFKVPATCLAPVILVHPNGSEGMGAYIAASGWSM